MGHRGPVLERGVGENHRQSDQRSASDLQSHRPIGDLYASVAQFNIPRERLIILTKCYYLVPNDFGPADPNTRDYVNHSGLSRAAIFNAVEASLKRLDTPYIDLLQIHRADLGEVEAEETMKALNDLVQSGKVRYIGASSMWAWQLQHYNHVAEVRLSILGTYKIQTTYCALP